MSKFDLLLYEGNSRHLPAHIVLDNSRTLFRTNYINMGHHEREVRGDQIYRHPHLLYIDRLVQKKRNSSAPISHKRFNIILWVCNMHSHQIGVSNRYYHYSLLPNWSRDTVIKCMHSRKYGSSMMCTSRSRWSSNLFYICVIWTVLVSLLQWKCQTYIPIQVNYFHISRIKTESYRFPFDDR